MLKTYLRLLGFAKPIGRYAVPYFFYSLLYALFNSCTFLLIIPILNTMFKPDYAFEVVEKLPPVELDSAYLETLFNYCYGRLFTRFRIENVLILLAAIAVGSSFLSNLFRYLGSWTVEQLRTKTLQRIRNDMFTRVIDMHAGYFSDQRKGDIISKITSDVNVVQFCITNTLQVAFREPFLIIFYLIMMVGISWELSLFSLFYLPIVALLIGSIVKRLRHPALTNQQRMGELVSALDESLSGIKVIKSYNATDYIKRKFYAINADLSRITLSMARRQQLASPMSEFLGITAVGVMLVFGGALVVRGWLNAGGFIAFIAMFSQITRPVRTFIDQFANINQGIAAGERIFSIIDTRSEIEDKPQAQELRGLKEKIEFRDIHFSYDGSREVIDGRHPLRDYRQESLRAHMSVVSQDTVLFNDTIESNIALGRPGATHAEVVEAARIANADAFIRESPDGYDTNIGDRGSKLSGGQRQRLSIARAVLKNPDILILDEATSALDTESEKLVQEALNKLLVGRTSIVIAHRLSTIRSADRIFVVDHGRIVEQGTHAELMAKGGIYAKLIEMQSFE